MRKTPTNSARTEQNSSNRDNYLSHKIGLEGKEKEAG